jgi:CHAT domain-containing protein
LGLTLVACNRQGFSRPEDRFREANSELERGELIKALQLATDGTRRYTGSQPAWGARFLVLEAEVLVWQGKSKDALSLLNDPLPQSSSEDAIIRRKVLQAIAKIRLQSFGEASSELSEAEQMANSKQPDLLADVVMVQGTLALMTGDYQRADSSYHSALRMARQQDRLFLETTILGNLGVLALKQQRYGEAIDWFTTVEANSSKLHNQTIASRTLGNLGWCYYSLGDFDRALDNYIQAEAVSRKLGSVQDQLTWLNDIGLVYDAQHDYQRAAAYYQQSLNLASNIGNRSASMSALSNLALAALETGYFDQADQYNLEALRLQREIGEKATDPYPTLNAARIAVGRKQYPEAAKLFEQVIHNSGEDVSLRWEAESNLAGLYASEGNTALADAQYRRALATIDKARASLSKEEHRLSFLNTATRFYNDYIDFLVVHNRAREALAVAEHSRARTLAEGLKLPVSQLRAADFHPEQSARKLNSVVLSYWLKPERSFLWVVTPSRVALFPLPAQNEIDAAVTDYRKALLDPRAIKEAATGQKLYDMLVAPAEKLIPKAPSVTGPQAPCPASAAVSRCGSAPRVTVIADGSLLTLNFETLLVPSPQPHFWIEDATLSSASSIALLDAKISKSNLPSNHVLPLSRSAIGRDKVGKSAGQERDNQKLLLIGDPNYTGTEFPQLSHAKIEVQKVESYFSEYRRVVIQGNEAVPAAYASTEPGRFGYIHFVAHGTASRVSPLDSSIVLSKEGDAYKLYARDIMRQPLKADLVTVSACYGAGNRTYSGEGLVGLSWAFLRAGAHNVIAALWEVNDASTPQLMDNLYLNINNGQDPAVALRNAKLAMLHSSGVYRRPFYWAAFQIYIGS